jgi:CheY-like chemotaxis protein
MKPSILIVDDREVICDSFAQLLSEDYKTYKAFNGREALDIIKQHDNIDVVISDIMMPVMDGIKLTEMLRSDYKDLVIVAMTGVYSAEKVCEVLEKGADTCLMKPVKVSELEILLKKLLKNKESAKNN